MSRVSGYFLLLNKQRYSIFENNLYNFSEPVSEFTHPRHVPLVCFITNDKKEITHIALAKKGLRAGTGLLKLNIDEVFKLNKPISAIQVANKSDSRIKSHLIKKLSTGGIFSKKSFNEFLNIFLKEAPETIPILEKYSADRQIRISRLSINTIRSLAEQKEAILTALNIAGIDKNLAQGWDYDENEKPSSFLDGITHVRLREDSMVVNDLGNIPGFNLIKTTKFSSSVFENSTTRLTVLLTNRLPLEELLGTDLIYYNEDFKCFIMVQYKVMEKENDKFVFRLPNSQLTSEISRMDSIIKSLESTDSNSYINDFRFSMNPFFIKMCPRLEFDPDYVGLSTGMYVPIDYLKILEKDKSIEGNYGGRAISYDNIGRYLDNTGFKTIIEGGWVGTNQNQSKLIESMIKEVLNNGKAAVLAIKKKIQQ